MSSNNKASHNEPVLIVPDVHLRVTALADTLQAWGGRGPVIFLGDFFDDFGDSAEANLKMAEFIKTDILGNPRHTVLMGNHDLHYHPYCPSELWCSGFHPEKKEAINQILRAEDFGEFKWATHWKGVLLTHAGLHPRLAPPMGSDSAEELSKWVNTTCQNALDNRDPSEPLLRAGRIRGGFQPVGGVIWMDAREYQPVGRLRQVFGHTPLKSPMPVDGTNDGSWCVDTNLNSVAVLKEGKGDILLFPTHKIVPDTFQEALSGKPLGGKITPENSRKRSGISDDTRRLTHR